MNKDHEESIQYKIPHVCFYCDVVSNLASKHDLMRFFCDYLSKKFENVSIIGYSFIRKQILIRLEKCSILVDIEKSRFNNNEWVVLFGPIETPIRYSKSFVDTYDFIKNGLVSVTSSLNELLVSNPNVRRIRWYFEYGKYQSEAFQTPTELPW